MVARVSTVAFEGVEARPVDVQVQIASGTVAFTIVGLGDKAVAESRERVRSALIASGLALPAKRITVNLAPADMPKEGSHYDDARRGVIASNSMKKLACMRPSIGLAANFPQKLPTVARGKRYFQRPPS